MHIINPSDGESLGSLTLGTEKDVDEAVKAAKIALETWRCVWTRGRQRTNPNN
jgi:acyl-CoA reductase-like NAD-dependent aldehyde dehydrogenase